MALGHSKKIEKKDIIDPLLKYFKKKLEEKSLNDLRNLAFQILLRKEKILEKEFNQVYDRIILEEKRKYSIKDHLN
ncbi:hypothetical protein ES703_65196 [subsurface metagenome]